MNTALGIFFLLMALGLINTTLPPFIVFFSFLRERAFGKAIICLLSVVLQVGLGYLLVTTGIGYIHSKSHTYDEAANVREFIATMEAANRATQVINHGTAYSIMSETDAEEMIRYFRAALAHAEKVDANSLNEKYRGWGTHFEKEFLAGLLLIVEENDKAVPATSLAGQKLLNSWGIWFDQNVEEIRKLR
jgi:hypothetical protein